MAPAINVLQVDNSELAGETADFLESEARFEVETASTAAEAISRLAGDGDRDGESTTIDCVVSDYDIPGTDGIELLEAVREAYPDLPFILFTDEGDQEIASEAISRGVNDYLEKPPPADQYTLLANRIAVAVAQYRAQWGVKRLHEATRTFMRAQSREEVCDAAIRAIGDVLEFPLSTIWLLAEDAGELRPVAASDAAEELVDEIPTYPPDDSPPWQVFQSGQPIFAQEIDERSGVYGTHASVRTEMILPLGDHGVMNVGSTRHREIDDIDRSLAELLAANVEAALDRATREQDRVRSERRFRTLFEQSVDAIFLHTAEGEVVDVNEHACEVLGYDREDLVGRHLSDIDRETTHEELVSLLGGMDANEVRQIDGVHRRDDGSEFPVEVRVGKIDAHGDAEFFAAVRDVSEQRAREQELQRQNQRLEEFAGVVSHDLRNPLHVAKARLGRARKEYESDDLEAVERSLDRMEALIDDLLTFAREGATVEDVQIVSLATIANDSWENVGTGAATLVTETDARIRADPGRLRRLFENLFRNSVEHGSTSDRSQADDSGERGGAVTVTVGDLDGGFYVEDDGPGIPPDERDRVFESGYSTSPDGTGFGLSIVQEIADAHDWDVSIATGEDGGARFEITGVDVEEGGETS